MKRMMAILMVFSIAGCSGEDSQAEKDLEEVNQENRSIENKVQNLKNENDQLKENIDAKQEELNALQNSDAESQNKSKTEADDTD
ncbi:hypothetical protein [Salinicoccus sp. CNSTN-B1]